MFSQVFMFILNCFKEVVNLFRGIEIDPGFSYFDFLVCCSACLIMFQLLRAIISERQEDQDWLRRSQRYDEYKVKDKLRQMDERDEVVRK